MKELNELHSDSLKGEKKIKEENILKYCLTVSPVVSLYLFPECFLVAFDKGYVILLLTAV